MNESITIIRIFNAPREQVWKAWTTPKMIQKWWGPEGFTAPSIQIDFREGGRYTYAMHGPEGSEWDRDMYSSGVFKEIIPMEKIVSTDHFSDKDGNKIDPSEVGMDGDFPPQLTVTFTFEDVGENKTKLSIIYPKPANEEQWEAMLRSGMEEGWNSSLNKIETVLNSSE